MMKLRKDIKTQLMLTENQAGGFSRRKLVQKAFFDAIKQMIDPGVKPINPNETIERNHVCRDARRRENHFMHEIRFLLPAKRL